MSAAAVMAIVMFLFFLVGVGVGVVLVIAASARRAERAPRRIDPPPPPSGWPYNPETGPDNQPDEPPWWRSRSN